jgi:hypothetical protein
MITEFIKRLLLIIYIYKSETDWLSDFVCVLLVTNNYNTRYSTQSIITTTNNWNTFTTRCLVTASSNGDLPCLPSRYLAMGISTVLLWSHYSGFEASSHSMLWIKDCSAYTLGTWISIASLLKTIRTWTDVPKVMSRITHNSRKRNYIMRYFINMAIQEGSRVIKQIYGRNNGISWTDAYLWGAQATPCITVSWLV